MRRHLVRVKQVDKSVVEPGALGLRHWYAPQMESLHMIRMLIHHTLKPLRFVSSITAVLTILASSGRVTAQPRIFTVTEIPMPASAVSMSAHGINNKGDVVGSYTLANGQLRAFVWSENVLSTLPPLPGHNETIAQGISDDGLIAGHSGPSFQPNSAVVWSKGQPQALGTFGGAWASAMGVSSSGLVAGWAQVEPDSNRFHGFVDDGATMRDIGLLPGGVVTDLADVNAAGMAVGTGQTTEGHLHAILVDPAEGILDLGTLGGVTSAAEDISDAGHIVGRAQTGERNNSTFEGIVRHAFLWHDGKMLDLGTLPGLVESRGMGVNSAGQVVGTANNATFTQLNPFLWADGTMTDLNTLLPPGSGWVLRTANAINDSGWIIGGGTHDGQPRAYLLQPVAQR
jgi:probable HAF family extracellular repeat protein